MFFVSSRRRHTRWPRDWSSDVCSSDLHGAHDRHLKPGVDRGEEASGETRGDDVDLPGSGKRDRVLARLHVDRKSTRLNSSHVAISYAVFCLKKKKMKPITACTAHASEQ